MCNKPGCNGRCTSNHAYGVNYSPCNKCGQMSCTCHMYTQQNKIGCYSGCNKNTPLPNQPHPLCGTKEKTCYDFEETCDQETFDASQIRYKTGCDKFSELENLNIGVGENLEYILEEFGKRIENFDYLASPTIPNMPLLNSYEKVINYLLEKIEDLQNQINLK